MRNILTNLDETLVAMSSIEDRSGDYWLQTQRKALDLLKGVELTTDPDDLDKDLRQKVAYSVGAALIECKGRSVKPDYWSQEDWDEMREGIATIVYGSGGWNRWGVQYDGGVLFSEYHARDGDTKLAKAAGFKTW